MAATLVHAPRTDLADIKQGLAVLASCAGNVTRAAVKLGIPRTTIRKWRDSYPDEYASIAQGMSDAIEQRLIAEYRETTLGASEAARLAVKRAHEKLQRDEDNQPSATAQRLATTAGILTDKTLTLEGRPTSIHAESTVDEDLRFLRSRAVDAQVVEDTHKALETEAND